MDKRNSGNLVSYAQVNTEDRSLALQIDVLKKAGCHKKYFFVVKVSGAKSEHSGLNACIESLHEGDT